MAPRRVPAGFGSDAVWMSSIRPAPPRETVQARCPTAASSRRRRGRPSATSCASPRPGRRRRARGGGGGGRGRLRELTMPLLSDADVAPVTLSDTDGSRIYRRSLTLLLVTAAAELFPKRPSSWSTRRRRWARITAASAAAPPFSASRARRHRRAHARHRRRRRADPQDEGAGGAGRGDLRGARRDRQGAAAGAPAAGQPGAVRAVRTPGLLPGLHAAVHRTPAPVRAASAGRRLRAAVPAHGQARTSWRASRPIRSCSRRSPRPATGWTRWASAAPAR